MKKVRKGGEGQDKIKEKITKNNRHLYTRNKVRGGADEDEETWRRKLPVLSPFVITMLI